MACSLCQGMQSSQEEEEVHWEPMQPAMHPAFAVLHRGSPQSSTQQHPWDWSNDRVSQGWAWGQRDPAFCTGVSHRAKLPQPGSPGAPSIAALSLVHTLQPARVCSL